MPLASPYYQSTTDQLNKSGSEISMAIYRYEDKGINKVTGSPKSKAN